MEVEREVSTLEQAIVAGVEKVGNIGVEFTYKMGPVNLSWRVRVLAEDGEVLHQAPYSLAFVSSCCQTFMRSRLAGVERGIMCSKCSELQTWTMTDSPLSLLGRGRDQALDALAYAYNSYKNVNALEALAFALDVVEDIEKMHKKYMTEAWVNEVVGRIKVKRKQDRADLRRNLSTRIPVGKK